MDVFARREVHHGVGTPLGRPTHFFDFLLDGTGHGRVADVGVDLHQEVAPDDHWLQFRVVDVGGDDRPSSGNLRTHELGRDKIRNGRPVALTGVLLVGDVARAAFVFRRVVSPLPAQIFADGDVFHLRRDDPLPRVPELCHRVIPICPQRLTLQTGKILQAAPRRRRPVDCQLLVSAREVSVVLRHDFTALVGFHVAPTQNPLLTQGRQPPEHVAVRRGVPPRATRVVQANRRVFLHHAAGTVRARKRHLTKRHTQLRMDLARHVHPAAVGKLVAAVGTKGIFRCDHRGLGSGRETVESPHPIRQGRSAVYRQTRKTWGPIRPTAQGRRLLTGVTGTFGAAALAARVAGFRNVAGPGNVGSLR